MYLIGVFFIDERLILNMLTFDARDIFEINCNQSAYFPLNLELKVKNHLDTNCFKSPGIYSIFYKGELIYIGFSANNDDIRTSRWVRQLATITLRGNKVLFTEEALKALKNSAIWCYFAHLKLIVSNQDFQTSKNRVLFASYHWDVFINLNQNILKEFEFQWKPMPNHSKQEIEMICRNLKNKYTPRCNKEYSQFKLT